MLPQLGIAKVTDRGTPKKSCVHYIVFLVFEGRLTKVALDCKKPNMGKPKKTPNKLVSRQWKRYPFKLLYPADKEPMLPVPSAPPLPPT